MRLSEPNILQKVQSAARDCACLPQNLNMTGSTGAAQLDAEKMTHLLVTTVSTEPEEGLHVGT